MPQLNQAILSNLKVTYSLPHNYTRDRRVIRNGASNIRCKQTALKLAQLEKIRMCNQFTKAFVGTDFFNRSFPENKNADKNEIDILISQSLTGDYPNIQLSYPLIKISKGSLPVALHAAAVPMEGGNIYFCFTDNSDTGIASSSDKIILVAYAPALQQAVFTLNSGLRKDCEAILHAAAFKDQFVETWMAFLNTDGSDASDSVYTGRIKL